MKKQNSQTPKTGRPGGNGPMVAIFLIAPCALTAALCTLLPQAAGFFIGMLCGYFAATLIWVYIFGRILLDDKRKLARVCQELRQCQAVLKVAMRVVRKNRLERGEPEAPWERDADWWKEDR